MKDKDEAAVALGKKRWKGKTAEERLEHSLMMAAARTKAMTKEERSASASKAAKARWRGDKKKRAKPGKKV